LGLEHDKKTIVAPGAERRWVKTRAGTTLAAAREPALIFKSARFSLANRYLEARVGGARHPRLDTLGIGHAGVLAERIEQHDDH
jgi:hypothetical protein